MYATARLAAALSIAMPVLAVAQAPADAPSVITATTLAADLTNPRLVLLHVGDQEGYAKAHIAGARLLELSMITASSPTPPLQNELPEPAELEARLEALGIGDASRVVVYFAKAELPQMARVAFTLDYAGLGGRTFVLDGGLPAWVRAGQAVTDVVPAPPTPGTLTITPKPSALVDLAWLRANTENPAVHVVDARPVESYTGADDRGGAIKRPGHVPGAVNVPYSTFFRDDLTLKPVDELKGMLTTAGARPGEPLISYCTSGVQASVPYLVARLLGYEVKIFDGSYQQWSASDAPVVKGSAPR